MKKYIYLLIIVFIAWSCQEEDNDFKYDSEKDNVYFGNSDMVGLSAQQIRDRYLDGITDPRDVFYSFAVDQKLTDTVFIPVTISGKRVNYERKFKVQIAPDFTTAESPLHFAPLAEYYTIPADSGHVLFPVVLYNKDEKLQDTTFYLKFKLIATEDFDVAIPGFDTARMAFSGRLEKPVWWPRWERELGTYSRTKHALYLISLDGVEKKDLPPNLDGENGLLIPYALFVLSKFQSLLVDPFIWVEEHPEYVIVESAAGVYDFYNAANPFRKYTLMLNDKDGKYYFLDENGKFVSMSS